MRDLSPSSASPSTTLSLSLSLSPPTCSPFFSISSSPPDILLVSVGDRNSGVLGNHFRTMEETWTKVNLRDREHYIRLHSTAVESYWNCWSILHLQKIQEVSAWVWACFEAT